MDAHVGLHVGQNEGAGHQVSALMDGEVSGENAVREIARLKADAVLREHWDTYHLIGDALRGNRAAPRGFTTRFSERLALEPTVLAPRLRVTRKMQTYALSAAASVAAVAVVGWTALSVITSTMPGVELAQVPQAPVTTQQASALASAQQGAPAQLAPVAAVPSASAQQTAQASEAVVEQVQEYLLAHQGISPSTAIQGVTPYVRTVSNTGE